MNFQLAEIVPVNDAEKVLQVLELHLRGVAAEVVRSNGQITAYGIGPSPRIVNRRDTTVVAASSVDGVTKLTANVNYQASALLGNSPQNEIVKAKIERAIDEMRAELKSPRPWIPRVEQVQELPLDAGFDTTSPFSARKTLSSPQKDLFEQIAFESTPKPMFVAPPPSRESVAPRIVEAFPATGAGTEEVALPWPSDAPSSDGRPADPLLENARLADARLTAARPREKSGRKKPGNKSASWQPPAPRRKAASSVNNAIAAMPSTASDIAARKTIESPPNVRLASGQIVATKADAKDLKFYKGKERRTGKQKPMDGVTRVERRRIAPMIEVPLRGLLRAGSGAIEDAVLARKWWKLVLPAVAALLLMAAAAGYLLRDQLPGSWKTVITGWSKQMIDAVPRPHGTNSVVQAGTISAPPAPMPVTETISAPTPVTVEDRKPEADPVAKVETDTVANAASPLVADPAMMVKPEHNIYQWVQDWSAALQSRDPGAQASYYAHAVDEYLSHTKVTRDYVLKDKTARIKSRGPVWSINVDRVYVQKQNDAGATLRAVKHLIATSATGDSTESDVRVRLKLVRFEGTWKIVEEQDLN